MLFMRSCLALPFQHQPGYLANTYAPQKLSVELVRMWWLHIAIS